MYSSLISPKIVQENLENPKWRFFDCRFDLNKPDQKQAEFKISHLPGSSYINLDYDLSIPQILGKTGRHPLPGIKELTNSFSLWGIDSSIQVVVYDDFSGAHASRFWWMLRWLGHDAVAVMDGGWNRWINQNRPMSTKIFSTEPRAFRAYPRDHWCVNAEKVMENINVSEVCILDARSGERFRGENETLDPVGGHIPGAVSAPFSENLNADGNWKSNSELKKMYLDLLDGSSVEKSISYCGSGITACHNILAMSHAGLGFSRLYPGSWSDWINDPLRPVSVG